MKREREREEREGGGREKTNMSDKRNGMTKINEIYFYMP